MSNVSYVELTSAELATLPGVQTTIGYDLRLPPEQPNPHWYGSTQLFISIPSRGIHGQFVGEVQLNTLAVNQFRRVQFQLPSAIQSALGQTYQDLRFRIVLNVPAGSGAYLFDNLGFGAGAPPCDPATVTDDNPCTADSCGSDGPIFTPLPAGTACPDGNACNGAETCDGAGTCMAGRPPTLDDGNACTNDSCAPASGVQHVPVPAGTACADATVCNGAETCNAQGACTPGTPPLVDDGNPCTVDSCDPVAGVTHAPATAGTPCADANACNGQEACDGSGACVAGQPPVLDDGNPCTADACDPTRGITHLPVAAGTACADGNLCNGAETCNAQGACTPGTPPVADDGNPCTVDSCDPVLGIVHAPAPVGTSCADGSACNGVETCDAAGTCQPGTPVHTEDGDPCTAGSCDPATGEVTQLPAPAGTACNVDACSGGICDAAGVCQPDGSAPADDGDPCTLDTCDPETGVLQRSRCAPIDRTVATNVRDSMSWIYSGPDAVQIGVAPDTIQLERAAVLRGEVRNRAGAPVAGVTITLPGHPELGSTTSHLDGTFDLVVNGGGPLTLDFTKTGYLNSQRQVHVPWGEFVRVPNVVLVEPDPVVTRVDLQAPSGDFQIATGSLVTDEDGDRQAVLLFPAGTEALMHLPDGTAVPLTELSVRATEYTVGSSGPDAMPAPLPPTSGYTYAVEFNADEAVAAGAPSIEFSQPLVFYVDNFLGFPTGTLVPVGAYDREIHQWVPHETGIVLSVVGVSAGAAEVDVTGDGLADSGAALAGYGITAAELAQLASLYTPGQSVWRVLIPHFTEPYDCNWPFGPPDDAEPPPRPDRPLDDPSREPGPGPNPDDPCEQSGSIIECQTLTLRERLRVAGTPYTLNYASDRSRGRTESRVVDVALSGSSIPASVKRIELEVEVGGRQLRRTFPPAPRQTHRFEWDAQDAYGRAIPSRQPAKVTVGYVYDGNYTRTDRFGEYGDGTTISGSRTREEIVLSRSWSTTLGGWTVDPAGLGGWTLDVHHAYSPTSRMLALGDGTRRSKSATDVINTVVTDHPEYWPVLTASGPDGSLYYIRRERHTVQRVAPDGTVTLVAGTHGSPGFGGDGGPATSARLNSPRSAAVATDGSLFIADSHNHRIRKVSPDGLITTVAGNGVAGIGGEGELATQTPLSAPEGVAVAPDGSLYVAETGSGRVRRIDPAGIVTTAAGTAPCCPRADVDVAPAREMTFTPRDIAVTSDGICYVAAGTRLIRVDTDGLATVLVRGDLYSYFQNGGPSRGAAIGDVSAVELGPDGTVYIVGLINLWEGPRHAVLAVTPDYRTYLVAGGGRETASNGAPATSVNPFTIGHTTLGLAHGPDALYVSDSNHWSRIFRLGPALPGLAPGSRMIASDTTDEVFVFDYAGRHMSTLDALTGAPARQFRYANDGQLEAVVDSSNNVTRIERDPAGRAVAIVGPFGHRTQLGVDENGYLSSIANPEGERVAMRSTEDGLLESFTDPSGHTTTMSYDVLGRLGGQAGPSGARKLIQPERQRTTWRVAYTSNEGQITTYSIEQLASGGEAWTTTLPDGSSQQSTRDGQSGLTAVVKPDGTSTVTQERADPRFGVNRPLFSTTTTLPSGLSRVEATTRTATLTDAANPFSLQTEVSRWSLNGQIWQNTYTSSSRTLVNVSPMGRQILVVLDELGRPSRTERSGLHSLEFRYDEHGRLSQIQQGDRTATNAYHQTNDGRNGYALSVTNALLEETAFVPDAVGRPIVELYPDQEQTSFGWDESGNLESVTPPGRPAHAMAYTFSGELEVYTPPALPDVPAPSTSYLYNDDRQLRFETRPDGSAIERRYDSAGRLDLLVLPTGEVDHDYYDPTPCLGCAPGRLSRISGPSALALDFTYDGQLQTGMTWSGDVAGGVAWGYNNDFLVSTETVTAGSTSAIAHFGYDRDLLPTCLSPTSCAPPSSDALRLDFNGAGLLESATVGTLSETFSYNGYGELATYTVRHGTATLYSATYDSSTAPRDALGRVRTKVESILGATHTLVYAYDRRGRLMTVTRDGTLAADYDPDANGNRLAVSGPAGTTIGSYDDQDRLLAYGNFAYEYTPNGDLLSKTHTGTDETTSYVYDARGSLLAVDLPDGTAIDYVIDGRGRRVGKKLNDVLVQGFLYKDQHRIVAELDGAGALISQFVYAGLSHSPDLMVRGGRMYRFVKDQVGSPRLVVDVLTGEIAQELEFDEFGVLARDTNPGFQPFGFAGGLHDPDTGLVRFGARDYDPVTGRWTAKDPIRFQGDGTNLYLYVGADPVNWIDTTGEAAVAVIVVAEVAVGLTAAYCALNPTCREALAEAGAEIWRAVKPKPMPRLRRVPRVVPKPDTCEPPELDCDQVRSGCIERCTDEILMPGWWPYRDRGPDFQRCVQTCLRAGGC